MRRCRAPPFPHPSPPLPSPWRPSMNICSGPCTSACRSLRLRSVGEGQPGSGRGRLAASPVRMGRDSEEKKKTLPTISGMRGKGRGSAAERAESSSQQQHATHLGPVDPLLADRVAATLQHWRVCVPSVERRRGLPPQLPIGGRELCILSLPASAHWPARRSRPKQPAHIGHQRSRP